jgi:hypothetical protein
MAQSRERKIQGFKSVEPAQSFLSVQRTHVTLREQLGREASPTTAVIDSQTLKAAEKGAVLMAR